MTDASTPKNLTPAFTVEVDVPLTARRGVKLTPEERKAAQNARNKAYYEANRDRMVERARLYREQNPEAAKAAKQKYYASDKGKAQKKREDQAYVASGGRAATEMRRALLPLSEARLVARRAYQVKRRAIETALSEFDTLVLTEAADLMRLRTRMLGTAWHVDHIVPVSTGGTSEAVNLQVVPALWNRRKSNKHSQRYFAS